MKDDENPGLVYEAEDGPDPLHYSHTPLVLIHDGGGTCFSCMHLTISKPSSSHGTMDLEWLYTTQLNTSCL